MMYLGKYGMHDEINLSYIGLSDLEVRVMKSIFTLAPQLNENYSLITPDRIDEADVILVNADDADSVGQWNRLSSKNRVTTSLMLTDDETLSDGDFKLRRPIRVQKLIAALEEIVSQTQTSLDETESDAVDEMRILVVDDSFPVRKYMEHKLKELSPVPLAISFAADGEEAIELAGHCSYDVIFLDVMMEGIDGYRACKTIKANGSAYIVMLTSKKSPFDKVRGTMSGCDAYVTKPPSDERLAQEIRKCLARRPELERVAAAAAAR